MSAGPISSRWSRYAYSTTLSRSPLPLLRASYGFSPVTLSRGSLAAVEGLNLIPPVIKTTLFKPTELTRRWASQKKPASKAPLDINEYTTDRIRNFSIIAHIDHGKSTLADRLLELTGTIDKNATNKQVLDKLKVERDRGITVKAQTASMFYEYRGQRYLLNLIDTPGHVDFSYEVSRSLAACQGTILLVDSSQGIQAQTVANFYLAFGENLAILPILNKIDLPGADPDKVANQIEKAFEIPTSDVLGISAKSNINVDQVLPRVIDQVPPPQGDIRAPFKALLFDSWYDSYVGVVCLLRIVDGQVRRGDTIVSHHSGVKYEVMEVGIMYPEQSPTVTLQAGQVGYIVCNMKTISEAHVGDTFYHLKQRVDPLPGFVPAKSMVFSGIFPVDAGEFARLDESIKKLTLNDSSVSVQKETSNALGQGWRLGFLGTLHMDVFRQRLEEEYDTQVIITQPTVPYRIVFADGHTKTIRTPAEFPDHTEVSARKVVDLQEPTVSATIIFPQEYLGAILELCSQHRCEQQEHSFLDETRVLMRCVFPMAEIVNDFYEKLKSKSSGYASFDYEEAGYMSSSLVKMNVLVNSRPVDALAAIVHRSQVDRIGRDLAQRLKKVIKRQLFEVAIQVSAAGRVVARETVSAARKDVTAKCYGGDVTRKMKLLQKQKQGKKRMKMVGNVELPQEAFLSVIKR
ncbi:Translation factor guf1 mitochondrial [Dispira parvispora]|uniref:Translation factor guf1 mitochondrial n=1 Tax=Dispira parvispora TaxID=1520584 RepID=A0A9W8E6N8_9FUNG|nr:Translation factor guf1 mitochondrial [Dispira parvispora]